MCYCFFFCSLPAAEAQESISSTSELESSYDSDFMKGYNLIHNQFVTVEPGPDSIFPPEPTPSESELESSHDSDSMEGRRLIQKQFVGHPLPDHSVNTGPPATVKPSQDSIFPQESEPSKSGLGSSHDSDLMEGHHLIQKQFVGHPPAHHFAKKVRPPAAVKHDSIDSIFSHVDRILRGHVKTIKHDSIDSVFSHVDRILNKHAKTFKNIHRSLDSLFDKHFHASASFPHPNFDTPVRNLHNHPAPQPVPHHDTSVYNKHHPKLSGGIDPEGNPIHVVLLTHDDNGVFDGLFSFVKNWQQRVFIILMDGTRIMRKIAFRPVVKNIVRIGKKFPRLSLRRKYLIKVITSSGKSLMEKQIPFAGKC